MQDTLFILHLLGMAMGVGTGFVMLALSTNAAKLPPEERMKFMGRASASSVVSSVGLLLLIVTGIIMAIQQWAKIGTITTFHIKLGLVLLLVIAFGIAQMSIAKLKRGEAGPADAKRMAVLGPVMTLLGVLIVVFAVLSFH